MWRRMCAGASLALLVAACGQPEGLTLGSCYHDKSGKAAGDCVNDNNVALAVLTFRDGEVMRAVFQRLRDPASTRIDSWDVFMMEGKTPVLCGQVSGRNGFGGYGEPISVIYSRPIGAVTRADFPSATEWQGTWKRLCTPPKTSPVNTVQLATPTKGTRNAAPVAQASGGLSFSFENYDDTGSLGGNLHVWNSATVEYNGCSIVLSDANRADRWYLRNPTVIDASVPGSRGHRSYPTFLFGDRKGVTPPTPALVTGGEVRCAEPYLSQQFSLRSSIRANQQ
jgi:hypothetical protein